MAKHLGLVITAMGDSRWYPVYQGYAEILRKAGMHVEFIDSWIHPKDCETGLDGISIYPITEWDVWMAAESCIDAFPGADVTILGACLGGHTALYMGAKNLSRRIRRVIAVAPVTWFRFATPIDYLRVNLAYSPEIIRRRPVHLDRRLGSYCNYRYAPRVILRALGGLEPVPLGGATDNDLTSLLAYPPDGVGVGDGRRRHGWLHPPIQHFIGFEWDTVAPPASVKRLYDACWSPRGKTFTVVPGLNHDFWPPPKYTSNSDPKEAVYRVVEECLKGGIIAA